MTEVVVNIKLIVQHLQGTKCFICGSKIRKSSTSLLENEQIKTKIIRLEYDCLHCTAKEKREIEFPIVWEKIES